MPRVRLQREDREKIVYAFEYADSLIRFTVSTYRGRVYMDVRAFWQPDEEGPWIPTKKGLRHNVEALDEWQKGLAAVAKAIDGTGSNETWHEGAKSA